MLAQHWSGKEILWKIPLRFLLDAASAWKNLLSGNPGYWLAVARAHFAFCSWAIRHGTILFKNSSSMNHRGIYKGSVVWKYFFQKKRHFSQIVH